MCMSSKKFIPLKDFEAEQIQGSSRNIFTAHHPCKNVDLNLTLVKLGKTNGFIFQIINTLIESCEVRLTCLECKTSFPFLLFW